MTEPRIYTARETVLGYANAKLKSQMRVQDVDFSTPQRNDTPSPQYNTRIVITPHLNTMFIGDYTLEYDRVHVSKFGVVKIIQGSATRLYDVIDSLNEVCNSHFLEEDLVDYALPVGNTGEITIDLQFQPGSLLYYSGAAIITPNWH